jgi:Resolvase, N terminal domain
VAASAATLAAAPGQTVILTVCEMKRLARNAAELMTLAAELQAGDIQLELLTGICDPNGMGSMLFAVLGVAAQLDRDYMGGLVADGGRAQANRFSWSLITAVPAGVPDSRGFSGGACSFLRPGCCCKWR